jgi:2-oxoglutarate dehydrogenase E2 component (dihydrolipoamide succinyltransferase)
MATKIVIPSVGESISEGTISRWLKRDGETVRQGEPIVEVETEKATTDVPAPAAGILHVQAAEGSTVAVGTVIGSIEPSGDGAQKRPQPAVGRVASTEERKPTAPVEPSEPLEREAVAEAPVQSPPVTPHEPPPPLPSSRRLAAGEQAASAKETTSGATQDGERRRPMSAIRQRISERLLQSQRSTATLTTFNEIDMSAVQEIRARHRENFRTRHGVDLGLMSFFIKACVGALKRLPVVNASIDGSEIVYHDYCNISVAVSTDRGLMVPVVRHAERMGFADIERTIAGLAAKARDGKLTVDDLQGGTFTITNGGVFGSLLSTPILNPPQSAILGMHTIQKRPVASNDQVVIRPMMYVALSYDHRLIDGRDAVRFLVQVKESVENPIVMMLAEGGA